MEKLLTREQFRYDVFLRDNFKCVICKNPATAAHHILERKLWNDQGFYLSNGVSLCDECHIKAEQTTISCEELRIAANIKNIILPDHLDNNSSYDKWGDTIFPNGTRLKGELFFEEQVQKILPPEILNLFTDYIKYPKTLHVNWSNPSSDDKVAPNLDNFINQEVVVLEKMDGENCNFYHNYLHARSLSDLTGERHSGIKQLHSRICHNIPDKWRICGENLTYKHSIHYHHLIDYFLVFSIWNDKNECLNWDDTIEWAQLLDLCTVPVLYRGIYDEKLIKSLYTPVKENGDEMEGYVIRLADSFKFSEFKKSVVKYVRQGHVQTSEHWVHSKLIKNELENKI